MIDRFMLITVLLDEQNDQVTAEIVREAIQKHIPTVGIRVKELRFADRDLNV